MGYSDPPPPEGKGVGVLHQRSLGAAPCAPCYLSGYADARCILMPSLFLEGPRGNREDAAQRCGRPGKLRELVANGDGLQLEHGQARKRRDQLDRADVESYPCQGGSVCLTTLSLTTLSLTTLSHHIAPLLPRICSRGRWRVASPHPLLSALACCPLLLLTCPRISDDVIAL